MIGFLVHHFSILNFIGQSSILKFISHWAVAISDQSFTGPVIAMPVIGV